MYLDRLAEAAITYAASIENDIVDYIDLAM